MTIRNRSISQRPGVVESEGLTASARKGYLKIQVTDDGRGISVANINRIFDIYDNNSTFHEFSSSNSALGLWLCKQLCQKMSGDIRAYSAVNQGTTFIFYVPVDNSLIFAPLIPNIPIPIILRPHGKVTSLVVDDYVFNRDLHRLLLEKEGVHVTLASDGEEALNTYVKNGGGYFDFIMMDVRMPIMNGFESAEKIRKWERDHNKKRVDIYFVSGEYFSEEDVLARLRAKGDVSDAAGIRCLHKPIEMEMLRRLIRDHKERLRI